MSGYRHSAGFSLLEVLVVVFIIGILAAMMTLSVGTTGGDRELEREIERIAAIIDLAAEEAVMQGREFGLHFYSDRYEFSTEIWETVEAEETAQQVPRWQVITIDKLLKGRELPNDIRIELSLEDRNILLEPYDEKKAQREEEDEDDSRDDIDRYQPQIFILSSGDVSPFVLHMRREFESEGLTLAVDFDASTEITADDIF